MIVNVACVGCDGTGSRQTDGDICQDCLGQGHIAVDRLPDGRVPPAYREWIIDLMRRTDGQS